MNLRDGAVTGEWGDMSALVLRILDKESDCEWKAGGLFTFKRA